jgi:hypothetical protein
MAFQFGSSFRFGGFMNFQALEDLLTEEMAIEEILKDENEVINALRS